MNTTFFERAYTATNKAPANDTREPDRPLVGDDECPGCGRTECPVYHSDMADIAPCQAVQRG